MRRQRRPLRPPVRRLCLQRGLLHSHQRSKSQQPHSHLSRQLRPLKLSLKLRMLPGLRQSDLWLQPQPRRLRLLQPLPFPAPPGRQRQFLRLLQPASRRRHLQR